MTTPTTPIKMSDVNTELGLSSTSATKLTDDYVRALARKKTGLVRMNDLRGKSWIKHLGHWTGAAAHWDAYVGASYDIIYGQRYITLGAGVANYSDNILTLENGGHPPYTSLGSNGDSQFYIEDTWLDYPTNPVVYKVNNSSGIFTGSSLETYGVWVNALEGAPTQSYYLPGGIRNTSGYITRTYTFNISAAGTYTWKFNATSSAYFSIDGTTVGDLTSRVYGNDLAEITGTKNLSAGAHTITWAGKGYLEAVSIRIQNVSGTDVWTTLTPVRPTTPFTGWAEVVRIPIPADGTPRTFYSANYYVKDTNKSNFGDRWGDYFGTRGGSDQGSMFVVQDDGTGNVTVSIPFTYTSISGDNGYNQTISNFRYALYYYSGWGQRFTQLESPFGGSETVDGHSVINGRTHKFTGFASDGTVTTSSVIYPYYTSSDAYTWDGNTWTYSGE